MKNLEAPSASAAAVLLESTDVLPELVSDTSAQKTQADPLLPSPSPKKAKKTSAKSSEQTRRRWLTFLEKKKIVEEAYSPGATIKGTARKHDVYPSQIRRWKKNLVEFLRNNDITDSKKIHMLSLKRLAWSKHRYNSETYLRLKEAYNKMSLTGKRVTTNDLIRELVKIDPEMEKVGKENLQHRVYRWLQAEGIELPRRSGGSSRKRKKNEDASGILSLSKTPPTTKDDSIGELLPGLSSFLFQKDIQNTESSVPAPDLPLNLPGDDLVPSNEVEDMNVTAEKSKDLLTLTLLEEVKPSPNKGTYGANTKAEYSNLFRRNNDIERGFVLDLLDEKLKSTNRMKFESEADKTEAFDSNVISAMDHLIQIIVAVDQVKNVSLVADWLS